MTKDRLAALKRHQQLCYTRSNSLPSGLGTESALLVQNGSGRMPSVTISDFSSTNHIDVGRDEDSIPGDVETAAINDFQVTLEDIARHRYLLGRVKLNRSRWEWVW